MWAVSRQKCAVDGTFAMESEKLYAVQLVLFAVETRHVLATVSDACNLKSVSRLPGTVYAELCVDATLGAT